MKKIIPLFLITLLMTGCQRQELREDLREYISTFSLQDAIQTYIKASSIDTKIEAKGEQITKTITTLSFDITKTDHPLYRLECATYENDIFLNKYEKYIDYVDDDIILHDYFPAAEVEMKTISVSEAHELIRPFFYDVTEYDSSYHTYGNYAGDLIHEEIHGAEDFYFINDDDLLEMKVHYVDDKGIDIVMDRTVNRLGMFVKNYSKMSLGDNYIEETIEVSKD